MAHGLARSKEETTKGTKVPNGDSFLSTFTSQPKNTYSLCLSIDSHVHVYLPGTIMCPRPGAWQLHMYKVQPQTNSSESCRDSWRNRSGRLRFYACNSFINLNLPNHYRACRLRPSESPSSWMRAHPLDLLRSQSGVSSLERASVRSARERSGGHNLAPFGEQRPLRSHCISQMTSSTMRARGKARRVGEIALGR